ncbi:MAG: hypothetical protein NTW31_02090, partial [Bacteroidetes bacterium]|nr:hypothetical protein [Bacteroidota bacterium]
MRKTPAALYTAFFTIGLVEILFPKLNWQISFLYLDAYYLRILTFTGLLILSILSVAFGLLKPAGFKRRNLLIGILVVLPGLLIPHINVKSVNIVLLADLFLFSGSLFIQIAGLQMVFSPNDKTKNAQKIVALYLVKSAGLIVGMHINTLLSGTGLYGSRLLLFVSVFFLLLSLALMFLLPFPGQEEAGFGSRGKNTVIQLISDKFIFLVMGGLIVYAGTEYCLIEMIPFYFSETFGIKIMQTLIPGVGIFMFSFIVGRFACLLILRRIKPEIVFLLSSLLCIFGLFTIFIGQKNLSLAASVMIGLGASGIFPLMISLALNR